MSYWSVYVSQEDEGVLKKELEHIAKKKRWSFSQAVTGILREHLIEEKKLPGETTSWEAISTQSFFEGYSEKDSLYDRL